MGGSLSNLSVAQEVTQMQAELAEACWMEVKVKLAAVMAKAVAEVEKQRKEEEARKAEEA